MSVELDPPELAFKRPFNREVSQVLRLRNPHSDPVGFKVKTTAPKQYCVRPNSGRIDPGGEVEVSVLLQAMKEDPAPDAKCRDKFLVQSVSITAEAEFANVSALWTHIEQTNKASIQEKKIRVVFLPADAQTPAKTNGVSHSLDTPSQHSASPAASTPYLASTQGPTSGFEDKPSDNRSLNDAVSSASNPAIGGVAAAAGSVLPSRDDVQAQLVAAKDQIAQLTSQLKEQGELRQRKGVQALEEKGYPKAAQALANPNQAAGVPLQYVALLCFIFFMIAFLFF
ncbi:MSP domain-containing protein [Venturia nashicola]|uniref:MSP domain-containing protein n=1 Tax=Venturia nashicola TaxID=86259 RepID=A0A4Z1NRQ9_9PEZI|nr:MSP domain-containing protein [Venturia nashicola]TLD18840.1 MSP domain-containing protein [Venturia nashicola]